MDLGLTGRPAAVLGSSRGLGKAIAHSLAAEGCPVAICARVDDALQATAKELEDAGAQVFARALDVTEEGTVEAFLDAAAERFGAVDILVGNVGGNRRGPAHELAAEDWNALWRLNVDSHLRAARAAVPAMIKRGRGSIVFIASIFGREAGGPGLAAYNATKSALISVAKIMALELAPHGIRVNTVAPGSIRFPGGSWDRRCLDDPEGMERFVEQNLPLGRFGHAHEIGDAVAFLASERASLITGTCLNVDGGQSRSLI
ncbi:MAG: SDR family NAD(P)-dependent oxidoreductase [Acidobacteriota bacterium]